MRIHWHKHTSRNPEVRPLYVAYAELVDAPPYQEPYILFRTQDPDEFFARYNALTVEKEPAPEAELTEEDKKNIAYTVGYLKEACQLIDEINGTKEPAPQKEG